MLLASGIVAAVCLVGAQQPATTPTPSAQGDALGQIVPVDPLITVGTLPNGLRYYIRANTQPRARAELRLVVNAGSVLEDEAHSVSFNPVEIDKERGVILEEWRLGLGADERIHDTQFPILLKGSRYAERLPIGKPEIIRNVNHERLKQFYADWYRPDQMAVIAVGDFENSTIETHVKSHFGSLPAPASPKPRPAYAVPDQPGTGYSVITGPEAT